MGEGCCSVRPLMEADGVSEPAGAAPWYLVTHGDERQPLT